MSMGRWKRSKQRNLWIEADKIKGSPGHPFYEALNRILAEHGFDDYVEERCDRFYAERLGRPSLPPGLYFRALMIGFFEGLDSERGIAWRIGDSLTLREFLGLSITDSAPDHSVFTKIRQRIDLETHEQVFGWVVALLAREGLVRGKTLGIDASTLEANAALRSIVRRDTGESYEEFLERLAKASGIETPTRKEMAKIDRNRPNKGSNSDWEHPHDPDARITKMKDGRTHLAHKVEHTVDLDTEALLAVTLQPADRGDTQSIEETIGETCLVFEDVLADPEAAEKIHPDFLKEIVADKGYHSNAVLTSLARSEIRTYISEPDRGRRNWKGKPEAKKAVYGNRRRIRGNRGKALLRSRGEKIERSFAHSFETGALRRLHLRGRDNARKRLLAHSMGFNLALLMRNRFGVGTPRALQGGLAAFLRLRSALRHLLQRLLGPKPVIMGWIRQVTPHLAVPSFA